MQESNLRIDEPTSRIQEHQLSKSMNTKEVCLCRACVWWNTGFDQFLLTLKSIPTVAMKLPPRKAPSLKRTRTQVFPTAESPNSITYRCQGQREPLHLIHLFKIMRSAFQINIQPYAL